MSEKIEYIFDFGSPNGYLAHRALPALVARTGASVSYQPCLLGGIFKLTGNQAPMMAFGTVKGKLAYEQLEMARFMSRHDITNFQFNPHFPVNTLLLMRAACALEDDPAYLTFIDVGFKAMWEQGENMSDPDVFVRVLTEAGLDGAAVLESTKEAAVKQKLIDNTDKAVARGVFGIPSFFVGDALFFGKDRLDQVEEAWQKQNGQAISRNR